MGTSHPGGGASDPLGGRSVLLVAPNLSTRMGGEAIKALMIHYSLRRLGVRVHQVTHARTRAELSRDHPELDITYIEDSRLHLLIWRSPLRFLVSLLDAWHLHRTARSLVRAEGYDLVHFTSPISPVLPYFRLPEAPVVIGPINGNIRYPPAFEHRLSLAKRLLLKLMPAAHWAGRLFRGKREARAILVAGGNRTRQALMRSGCRPEQLIETLDSGVAEESWGGERISHSGRNGRFVFVGRLVDFKAPDLAIRAVARTDGDVELSVVGDGPDRQKLEALANDLGVHERVRFLGWLGNDQVAALLRTCRAMVFPSLAEANGIVVQEAMLMGLPVIALDWGGPAELLTRESGIPIPAGAPEEVVAALAVSMADLAGDAERAERLAEAARARAEREGFRWNELIERWIGVYRAVLDGGALPKRA